MRKTYIHFTERQYAYLEEDAYRLRVSVSEIVRRLVEERYGLPHETVQPGRPYKSPDVEAVASSSPYQDGLDHYSEAARLAKPSETP